MSEPVEVYLVYANGTREAYVHAWPQRTTIGVLSVPGGH